MQGLKHPNTIAITVLRIVMGLFFTIFGEYKVFGTAFTLHGGFQNYIKGFLEGGAYPVMIPVLRGILADFGTPMAFAVAYGEFLIGVSLLIGVWSRIASVFGFALMMAMWLSGGYPGPHAAFWMYWGASLNWSTFALCFLVLAIGRPEELWSLRSLGSGFCSMR
jgi:thiosulfate dehydrogenase [quinone] large subunit